MSTIAINDLNLAGLSLFEDKETYLSDVNDNELNIVNGGFTTPVCIFTVASSIECAGFATSVIASAGGAISIVKAFK
jgi:hypothetical protein